MKLYLFDFDGTISNKDSFIIFSYYSLPFKYFLKFWLQTIFFYTLKIKTNSKLKESFFLNFKETDCHTFQSLCEKFEKEKLRNTIKKSFLNYVKNIDSNSKVVVVSASIKDYLSPWCKKMNFDLIATELEVNNGYLTGHFDTPNCNGKEKVRRIKEKYDLSKYNEVHVFGNSKGDIPMLKLGTYRYYNYFK